MKDVKKLYENSINFKTYMDNIYHYLKNDETLWTWEYCARTEKKLIRCFKHFHEDVDYCKKRF